MQSPHYIFWVNHVKAALAAQLLWASMMFAALVFSKSPLRNEDVTTLLFSASVPAAILGSCVSWIFLHWRLRSLSKFEKYVHEMKEFELGNLGVAPILRNVSPFSSFLQSLCFHLGLFRLSSGLEQSLRDTSIPTSKLRVPHMFLDRNAL